MTLALGLTLAALSTLAAGWSYLWFRHQAMLERREIHRRLMGLGLTRKPSESALVASERYSGRYMP